MTAALTNPLHSQHTFACETRVMQPNAMNIAKATLTLIVAVPGLAFGALAIQQASIFMAAVAFFASVPAFLVGAALFSRMPDQAGQHFMSATQPADEYFAVNDMNPRTGRDWIAHDTRVTGESQTGPHRFD